MSSRFWVTGELENPTETLVPSSAASVCDNGMWPDRSLWQMYLCVCTLCCCWVFVALFPSHVGVKHTVNKLTFLPTVFQYSWYHILQQPVLNSNTFRSTQQICSFQIQSFYYCTFGGTAKKKRKTQRQQSDTQKNKLQTRITTTNWTLHHSHGCFQVVFTDCK